MLSGPGFPVIARLGSADVKSNSLGDQCVVENADDVPGVAAGSVRDLMTATGAAGGEDRLGWCIAHLGQYTEFADLYRYCIVLGLIAKGASHTTARRIKGFDSQIRDQPQGFDGVIDRGKSLLVTMAGQQCAMSRHRL